MSTSSMPIERYAEIRAEMESGRLRDEVLARAGLTVDAWTVVQREWLEKMGAELERGRFELTNRYTQAFLERQRELAASMRVPTAPAERPSPPRAAAPGAVVMPALAPSPGSPPKPRSDPDLGRRNPTDISATGAALSFMHPPAPPLVTSNVDLKPSYPSERATTAPEAIPAIGEASNDTPPPSTVDPDSIATDRRVLPFVRPELAPELATWQAAAGMRHDIERPPELGTRVAPALVPHAPALPFRPPEAPPEQRSGRAALASQPDLGLNQPLGATTGPIEMPKGPVLPFRPPAEGHGVRPSPPPPPGQPSPLGHTPAAGPLEVLSLAQYASLCAELAVFPGSTEAIFRRYGLDTREKRSAVDAAWKERLRRDPVEYGAWQEMYRRYYAYWTKQDTPPA